MMELYQGCTQKIRDFVREININFVEKYGRGKNPGFGPFRRRTKVKCLLTGMKSEIQELLPNKISKKWNWNEITDHIQDVEWLWVLQSKNNNNYETMDDRKRSSNFEEDSEGYVIVYTDGACPGNGKSGAKAGMGVWFGDGHPLNVSRALSRKDPATNNVAEIRAVIEAIKIVKRNGKRKIAICTDSKYMIDSITKWILNWLKNGWLKCDGEQTVVHKVQYRQMLLAMEDMVIKWKHVKGHSDQHGNDMADLLAKQGAEKYKSVID